MRYRRLIARGKTYALPVLLSPEDYRWAMRRGNWFVTSDKTTGDHAGYACRRIDGKMVWLHKAVLVRAGKEPPSEWHYIGDHLNGRRLDNRRGNLRWATEEMNNRNRHGFAALQCDLDLEHPRGNLWNGFMSSRKLLSSSDLEAFISKQRSIAAETACMQEELADLFGSMPAVAQLSPA